LGTNRIALRANTLWSNDTILSRPVVFIEGSVITGVMGTTSSENHHQDVVPKSHASRYCGTEGEQGLTAQQLKADAWRLVELGELTLLPGLIDGHVHTVMPGTGMELMPAMETATSQLLLRAAMNIRRALTKGVTTVVDMGGPADVVFPLAEAVSSGEFIGARVLAAGPPVTITGGHCWPWGGEADSAADVVLAVRKHVKAGAKLIKIMGTGGGTPGTNAYLPQYSEDILKEIVNEARRSARMTAIHTGATAATRKAVLAGVDLVVHGHFHNPDGTLSFNEDVAAMMAEHRTAINPTLGT